MTKNIKCSQCRHLRVSGVYHPAEGGTTFYDCKADLSIKLNENTMKQLRDCSFFRSNIETAYEEVKRDLIQKIKEFLKKIRLRINL